MSAPLAHHGTRHTGSLRLACATAFIHLTERISSGQISILPKRALLGLQNLLPSRDTNNPKRTLRGALLSSLWRAGEDMVHSGPPSRGAAVGNCTVLGTLSLEVWFQLASNCACAIILGPCNSHGAQREVPHYWFTGGSEVGLLGQWGPSRVATLRTCGNQIRHATLVADPCA